MEFAEYHLKKKGQKRDGKEVVQDKLIFLDNLKTPKLLCVEVQI